MLKRQIRVNVDGVFQFAVTVDQDEPLADVALRAGEAMKLTSTHRYVIMHTGIIDFVSLHSKTTH